MEYIREWKETNSFEKRLYESSRLFNKYDRIPIIVDKCDKKGPDINNHKFLVPTDLTMGQFIAVLRKRIDMKPSDAIFLFLDNGVIVQSSLLIKDCYKRYADKDKFLYITYGLENTFGSLEKLN